ncbi:hypothetical protein SRHO_G00325810 [Serrasalmus rhombeus]
MQPQRRLNTQKRTAKKKEPDGMRYQASQEQAFSKAGLLYENEILANPRRRGRGFSGLARLSARTASKFKTGRGLSVLEPVVPKKRSRPGVVTANPSTGGRGFPEYGREKKQSAGAAPPCVQLPLLLLSVRQDGAAFSRTESEGEKRGENREKSRSHSAEPQENFSKHVAVS